MLLPKPEEPSKFSLSPVISPLPCCSALSRSSSLSTSAPRAHRSKRHFAGLVQLAHQLKTAERQPNCESRTGRLNVAAKHFHAAIVIRRRSVLRRYRRRRSRPEKLKSLSVLQLEISSGSVAKIQRPLLPASGFWRESTSG